jgi:hypothetical protein
MRASDVQRRWEHVLDIVKSEASIDVLGTVELRCFPTRASFIKELGKHHHTYRFPGNPADAYYLPEDRMVLIGTYVSAVPWVIDFICFHEVFHHIYRHDFDQGDRASLHRSSAIHREEIVDAFDQSGRPLPWYVEERLCDVFAARFVERIPRQYSALGRLHRIVIEPVTSARRSLPHPGRITDDGRHHG